MRPKPVSRLVAVLAFVLACGLAGVARPAATQAVVRVVLFYSPRCPHCHKVIDEVLPPLVARYGERLRLAGVDVTTPAGQALYLAAADHFGIPEDERGVPLMIVGSTVLSGDREIPARLPDLIEQGLASGGTEWPPIPELRAALAQEEAAPANAQASALAPHGTDGSTLERLRRDPVGSGVAVAVLLALLGALTIAVVTVRTPTARGGPPWLVPVLSAVGMGVAAYLSFVELTGQRAVCGPLGDCNAVQQSEYARLFGVLPVGVLGLIGYAGMLVAWLLSRRSAAAAPRWALWAMALVGTAFSAYLTFLEPFVIGAVCAWCIGSAIVVGLLLLAATAQLRARRS